MTAADAWWRPWCETGGSLILHVDLRPDRGREQQALALLDDQRRHAEWVSGPGRPAPLRSCRAALRITVCDRLGCANGDLSFGSLEYGKPYAKVNGVPAGASFNVSHSGAHGLVGFAERDEFGVDLEVRVPGRDFDGIGRFVYGPCEMLALTAATGTGKVNLFYRFWTLKER